jgi:dihydroneopterin aldolase
LTALSDMAAAVAGRHAVRAVAADAAMLDKAASCGVDGFRIPIEAAQSAAAFGRCANGVQLVATLFADETPDLSVLKLLAEAGFAGAMLDIRQPTPWGHEAGRLLHHIDLPGLRAFVEACRAAGLAAELAGGLETPDVPRLLVLAPDGLAFRGALRGPHGLDLARVQAMRALIPAKSPEGWRPAVREVDYRLLAARSAPLSAPAPGDEGPTDRVFIDDLVLPARVGAYAREIDTPQRVRFAVDAWVARARAPAPVAPAPAAEDMRDVFSYDLMTDGIRMLVASGHFALVETLAERIAALVLAHARVTRVRVRVQKLDTGSGVVGVEIERGRNSARGAIKERRDDGRAHL